MQTRVRRERARRPRPAQGFVTKTGAGMRLSRIGRPRMCVSRTRTSRTRVSAMRTSQTSPTRARRARAMGSRADQGRERDEHTPRPPMPHTRLPHTSRHRRIGGDRRSSPRPRSPIGTTPACRARGNRTGSGRPRSGAVSGRGPGAFVARPSPRSRSRSRSIYGRSIRGPIRCFTAPLHRSHARNTRAKQSERRAPPAIHARDDAKRRRPTGRTPQAAKHPAARRAAAATSAQARAPRRAPRPSRVSPGARGARARPRAASHSHPRSYPHPHLRPRVTRHPSRRAQSTARSRLRASLGGAHRVAPRTVTSRRCLAARRPIRHTVILSCTRNARGRPGRYRLHRPLVNPASRRARRDHASNAAITSHI